MELTIKKIITLIQNHPDSVMVENRTQNHEVKIEIPRNDKITISLFNIITAENEIT